MTSKQKQVEIYTLDYCPYCIKAKAFLKEHEIEFKEVQCEKNEDEMRKQLEKKFNLNSATFPQIIINGQDIGGYSDLIDKYSNNEISFFE